MPGRTELIEHLQQALPGSSEKVAMKLGHLALLIAAADTPGEYQQYRALALETLEDQEREQGAALEERTLN